MVPRMLIGRDIIVIVITSLFTRTVTLTRHCIYIQLKHPSEIGQTHLNTPGTDIIQ